MLLVEISLGLLALFLGFIFPETASHLFEHAELALTWLSLRRRLAGLSALELRLALLPVFPIPNLANEERFLVMVRNDFPCP